MFSFILKRPDRKVAKCLVNFNFYYSMYLFVNFIYIKQNFLNVFFNQH